MKKKSPRKKRVVASERATFTVELVQVGGSPAIRLPRSLAKLIGPEKQVVLRALGNCIVMQDAENPRAGWDEATREAVAMHGNELTDEDIDWLNAPMGPLDSKAGNG